LALAVGIADVGAETAGLTRLVEAALVHRGLGGEVADFRGETAVAGIELHGGFAGDNREVVGLNLGRDFHHLDEELLAGLLLGRDCAKRSFTDPIGGLRQVEFGGCFGGADGEERIKGLERPAQEGREVPLDVGAASEHLERVLRWRLLFGEEGCGGLEERLKALHVPRVESKAAEPALHGVFVVGGLMDCLGPIEPLGGFLGGVDDLVVILRVAILGTSRGLAVGRGDRLCVLVVFLLLAEPRQIGILALG